MQLIDLKSHYPAAGLGRRSCTDAACRGNSSVLSPVPIRCSQSFRRPPFSKYRVDVSWPRGLCIAPVVQVQRRTDRQTDRQSARKETTRLHNINVTQGGRTDICTFVNRSSIHTLGFRGHSLTFVPDHTKTHCMYRTVETRSSDTGSTNPRFYCKMGTVHYRTLVSTTVCTQRRDSS